MDHADWQQQLEAERFEITVQALQRCLKAGANKDDVETLARECGVDIRFITQE